METAESGCTVQVLPLFFMFDPKGTGLKEDKYPTTASGETEKKEVAVLVSLVLYGQDQTGTCGVSQFQLNLCASNRTGICPAQALRQSTGE